jgi:hypothetical protein
MKALMGKIAKEVRQDSKGREELRAFITESNKDSATITLKNGKKYIVSRHKPKTREVAA